MSYVKLPLYDAGEVSNQALCIPVEISRDWSGVEFRTEVQWDSTWIELRDNLDE